MSNEFIDETATAKPEVTEVDSIWLTPGSVKPLFLALSLLLAMVGLFAFRPLMFASLIAIAWISIAWISESRGQSDELPLS